jgi:hypothetical protein
MNQKFKNRVYIECSETNKKVKATILTKNEKDLEVETPTGYILNLHKKSKKSPYSIKIGVVEFHSDGRLIN